MSKAVIAADRTSRSARKFFDELDKLFGASIGVIFVRTREVERARSLLHEWSSLQGHDYRVWDHNHGFRQYRALPTNEEGESRNIIYDADRLEEYMRPHEVLQGTTNLFDALQYVEDLRQSTTSVVATDFQAAFIGVFLDVVEDELNNPVTAQYLRDHVQRAHNSDDRIFFLIQPHVPIPDILRADATLIELDPPSFIELVDTLTELAESSIKDALEYQLSSDEIEEIAQNGLGMAENEFSNAVSIATVELAKTSETDEPSVADFVRIVRDNKLELIRQTEVLDLIDPTDVGLVGGLDLLKHDLHKQRKAFTQEARDFGLDMPKGYIVVGPPGCLAANTVLLYKRGNRNSSRTITLEELHKKFNGIPTRTRPWDLSAPTYLHSFDPATGKVFYNRIVSVIDSGLKPAVRVVTDTHGSIVCTRDHPILNADGDFVPAGSLRVCDNVIVRGSMMPQAHAERHGRKERVTIEGLKYYNGGWTHSIHDAKTGNTYHYKRQHKAVLVFEAHLNGMRYGTYLRRLKHDPKALDLQTVPSGYIIHHMDENPANDELCNLAVMEKVEHDREHSDESNFNIEYTELACVQSIEHVGFVQTYDIQMAAPYNNFTTASGIIVHNTGKTLICKATSSVLGLPAIVFNLSAVFSSYVGSSEQRMRANLKFVEAMAPCILFFDEFDKAVPQGNENDSGTSSRILGTLLTWLNDRQERGIPVYVIASANDVSRLPPEVMRKGRFDNTWAVSMPSPVERAAILKIHVEKRGHTLTDEELKKAAAATKDFVGAELESVVSQALLDDFHEGNDSLTYDNVIAAINGTTPQSHAFPQRIQFMRDWAEKNAKMASSGGTFDTADDNAQNTGKPIRRINIKKRKPGMGSRSD